jgi:urease alpha subunit
MAGQLPHWFLATKDPLIELFESEHGKTQNQEEERNRGYVAKHSDNPRLTVGVDKPVGPPVGDGSSDNREN